MNDQVRPFGVTGQGDKVFLITLTHSSGIEATIITYGASLHSLVVPTLDSKRLDVVLGFQSIEAYESQRWRCGAIIGRTCSRIAEGKISVDGVLTQLSLNEGANHLHGGFVGFDRKCWEVVVVSAESVTLRYVSVAGEEGYPATLVMETTYALSDSSLAITWKATSDGPTVCNPTTHAYFNLNGHDNGSVAHHTMYLNSSTVAERNENHLFTGKTADAGELGADFTTPRRLDSSQTSLPSACFLFDKSGKMEEIGWLSGNQSRCMMTIYSDASACLFYPGTFIGAQSEAKGEAQYARWGGFCLEPMQVPGMDGIHAMQELTEDTPFVRTIRYTFSTLRSE